MTLSEFATRDSIDALSPASQSAASHPGQTPALLPTIDLFGIRLHSCRMEEAIDLLLRWIESPDERFRYVVTPNVNHVVLHQRDSEFARVYRDADFVIADGAPIVMASRLFRRPLPERVAGSDLVPRLFDRGRVDRKLRVFLLGARPEVNERAARETAERWPGVDVVGRDSPPFGFEKNDHESDRVLAKIAESRPDVLVVGLGSPKQEFWVRRHRDAIRARVALCVGATIDFLAGEVGRAPLWMRRWGLEWCYRIAREPRRLTRRYLRDAMALPRILWDEIRRPSPDQSVASTSPGDRRVEGGSDATRRDDRPSQKLG